jgi:hypothetical protein
VRQLLVFVSALAISACAGDDMIADGAAGICPDNTSTHDLLVLPQTLTRGDPVDIAVRWVLSRALDERTRAYLKLEADDVEVDLPLALLPDEPDSTYAGSVLNPFGAGASAGMLTIVTSGYGQDCTNEVSAATQIELQ